jgi:predicted acylesterase/phospholipase RssA
MDISISRRCHRLVRCFAVVVAAAGVRVDGVAGQTALVLSGGGSRGLAHAGAIVGLERRGLRPDLVVGASMGAIIGGLYASGLDPDSIWSITRTQDWQEMFSPAASRPGPDGEPVRPMTRLGLFADHLRFPDGLIPDWRVNRALVALFLEPSFRARGDFDALPLRYRSVTADLRTGEAVILASGDLARAIRASMAVPGVFAPVVTDGVPLVDGGLADYLPVGPARDAGADNVVAVDVIRPPPDRINLNPFQSALRAFRITLHNARTDPDTADITITPEINPDMFAAVFMRDPRPLLEAGLEAALALPDTFDNGIVERRARPLPEAFAGLRVEVNDSSLVPLVRSAFTPAAQRGFDRDAILDAADGLYATGLFTGVWPRVEAGGSADTLVVLAEAYAPTTMMGGGGYDTDRGFRGWAAVTHRLGSRTETTVAGNLDAIETWAVASARIRPANRNPSLALDIGGSLEVNDVRVFFDDEVVDESQVSRAGGWAGLSWRAPGPNAEADALLAGEWIDDGINDGLAWGPTLRITSPGPNATVVGTPLRLSGDWRFGDFEYRRYRAAGSASVRRGRFLAAAVADLTVTRGDAPADAWPALGDGHAMPGLRSGEGRGRSMAIAGIDLAVASPLESHVRVRLRAGTTAVDPSDLWSNRWSAGAAAGILWWTPLGKLGLEAGVVDGGGWLFSLDIGPTF